MAGTLAIIIIVIDCFFPKRMLLMRKISNILPTIDKCTGRNQRRDKSNYVYEFDKKEEILQVFFSSAADKNFVSIPFTYSGLSCLKWTLNSLNRFITRQIRVRQRQLH